MLHIYTSECTIRGYFCIIIANIHKSAIIALLKVIIMNFTQ